MTSRSRSDRPLDHVDNDGEVAQPRLGFVGYLRFFWRQLTSMRTALLLLLLLALAAVPGSLVPQTSSDPNGVLEYEQNDPDTYRVLDALGLFSTFSTPWFSAIYLLLFISLVGCIVPRTKHHFEAMRARPPKTPARLQRLVGYTTAPTAADAGVAIDEAAALLRRQGYRVERYGEVSGVESRQARPPKLDHRGSISVSAERGYLRETGNLIFHTALVGMLVTVAVGSGFGYTGQRVLVEGEPFTNVLASYDSINEGRFFTESALEPYSMRLDDFSAEYEADDTLTWHATDFTATVSTRTLDGDWTQQTLKVNSPLSIGGTEVYLLGNGYAPVITVRDPDGNAVFSGAVAFLPVDANLLSSRGVVKVPDGLDEQLGMLAFYYPDPLLLNNGTYTSLTPEESGESLVTLSVYQGDLGLDDGDPVNAYVLDIDGMEQIAGGDAEVAALELSEGETVELPNGLGTIEFEGVRRYISVEIHHDPTPGWALLFAALILGGLLVSLFIPRRRVWVKAVQDAGGTRLEYAGLARGEDPTLEAAVADLARRHRAVLGDPEPAGVE